ncbi:penicillin-binding protein [Salmonella enterica subsp. enterica]|uniref:Penicillin-binding protein n=1 Tax=Salmonella enterica I TaxID=59201 RepID=A0A447N878_SALET|nr:penicillin-binding protein [Salmonella enterica subsp. enterica]
MHIDGLKTGQHIGGRDLILSHRRWTGQRRLIAVVMGAKSSKGREEQAAKTVAVGPAKLCDGADFAQR